MIWLNYNFFNKFGNKLFQHCQEIKQLLYAFRLVLFQKKGASYKTWIVRKTLADIPTKKINKKQKYLENTLKILLNKILWINKFQLEG